MALLVLYFAPERLRKPVNFDAVSERLLVRACSPSRLHALHACSMQPSLRLGTFGLVLCPFWQVPCDPSFWLPQVSPVVQTLVFSKVASPALPLCTPFL